MTRIKVFEVGNGEDECVKRGMTMGDVLEERVNTWLNGRDIRILQIVQNTDTAPGMASSIAFSVTFTILYEESPH